MTGVLNALPPCLTIGACRNVIRRQRAVKHRVPLAGEFGHQRRKRIRVIDGPTSAVRTTSSVDSVVNASWKNVLRIIFGISTTPSVHSQQ